MQHFQVPDDMKKATLVKRLWRKGDNKVIVGTLVQQAALYLSLDPALFISSPWVQVVMFIKTESPFMVCIPTVYISPNYLSSMLFLSLGFTALLIAVLPTLITRVEGPYKGQAYNYCLLWVRGREKHTLSLPALQQTSNIPLTDGETSLGVLYCRITILESCS